MFRSASALLLFGVLGCGKIVGDDYRVVERDSCPTNLAGPALVAVPKPSGGTYCVDSTEVTKGQYKQFLDAAPSLPLEPFCDWKTGYEPDSWLPTFDTQDLPVAMVDWCDAYSYCKWAGKRLCGAIDGGEHLYVDANNPETSMWYRACTAGGERKYPYGNDYVPDACVGVDYGSVGDPIAVGTAGGCVGGFPGLFDMAGNLNEWEDSCNGNTGASDNCRWRGGSFQGGELSPPVTEPSCLSNEGNPARDVRTTRTGFRCCL